jgi:hypothetical protein
MSIRVALVSAAGFSDWMKVKSPLPENWIWLDRLCRGYLSQLAGREVADVGFAASYDTISTASEKEERVKTPATRPVPLWVFLNDTFFQHTFIWDPSDEKVALSQIKMWVESYSTLKKMPLQDIHFFTYNVDLGKSSAPFKGVSLIDNDLISKALDFQDMPLTPRSELFSQYE